MAESISGEISRILAGDRAAAAWLYDAFAPRLLRQLRRRFGGVRGLDPEDLLQDTILYVLSAGGRPLKRFLERADGRAPTAETLAQFLWSAACGIASNRRRSLRRHPAVSVERFGELEPAGGGEARALAREALERLGDCLFRSGDRPHLYFQLRYRDGYKPAEIARITGWSRRATYKLKQALDEALERCVEELGLGAP